MQKKQQKIHPVEEIVERFLDECNQLPVVTQENPISGNIRRRLEPKINHVIDSLGAYLQEINQIRQPTFIFDTGDPNLIGRFVALALIAQKKTPLKSIDSFYGSGVYALYYQGVFDSYAPINGTETPIYVGKADPESTNARTPTEQGVKLSKRLKEHKRTIEKATSTIKIDDFCYRCLVVQSGWQQAAENYLIQLFRPIWNNETQICYGFGKHGDDPNTRMNQRSPWDTIHPGREWAYRDINMLDAVPKDVIEQRISNHFCNTRIYQSIEDIFKTFIDGLVQL